MHCQLGSNSFLINMLISMITAMPQAIFRNCNFLFLAAAVVSFLNILSGLFLIFDNQFLKEMMVGWVVSFFNHIAQRVINQAHPSKAHPWFLIQCLGFSGLRAGVYFFVIVCILLFSDFHTAPFMYGLFGTYFIFLAYNVLNLYFSRIAIIQQNETAI